MTTAISSKLLNMSRKVTPVGTTRKAQHTTHKQHTSPSSLEASQDGWLLHLSSSAALADWTQSAHDISTSLSCLCCSSCAESLTKKTPQLPPAALANDNACLHPPPALQTYLLGTDVRRPWLCSSTPPNPLFLWRSGISTTGLAWYC